MCQRYCTSVLAIMYLEAIQRGLNPDEELFAFLDDLHLVSKPERVEVLHNLEQRDCGHIAEFGFTEGKPTFGTKQDKSQRHVTVRSCSGGLSSSVARFELPSVEQGVDDPGQAPCSRGCNSHECQMSSQLGCCSFIALQLVQITTSRVVRPDLVDNFAQSHDQGLWQCLCTIMDVPEDGDPVTRATASLPLSLGGLGLRTAQRSREAAYWASWSDTLPMIHARHPVVANLLVRHLDGDSWSPSLRAASQAATELDGLDGFDVPSWSDVAGGLRLPDRDLEDHEPGGSRKGWPHEASSKVEKDFRESLFTTMPPSDRALVRSQSGPGAGVAFSAFPSSMLTRIEAPLFRVLVQRCLTHPSSVLTHLRVWPFY